MHVKHTIKGAGVIDRGHHMEAVARIQQKGWLSRMAGQAVDRAKEGITLPQGFIVGLALTMIMQLVGSIWWAATLSANFNNLSHTINVQKIEATERQKTLDTEIKELKDKQALLDLTIQLLQVKVGVLEGGKRNGK